MAVERTSGGASLIDILDRVLDKGIVIDPWARVSFGAVDLTGGARLVVASIETHATGSDGVSDRAGTAAPARASVGKPARRRRARRP